MTDAELIARVREINKDQIRWASEGKKYFDYPEILDSVFDQADLACELANALEAAISREEKYRGALEWLTQLTPEMYASHPNDRAVLLIAIERAHDALAEVKE